MESLPTNVCPLFRKVRCLWFIEFNMVWQDHRVNIWEVWPYGHSQGGLIGSTLNDKAIALLALRLHSCSQLVRNLTSMRMNCPKTRPIIWMNPMHGSRLTTLIATSALIYLTHVVIMPLFIIVSGKLTADVNVNNALQIGEACMEA